jgi:hypothetical protein
MSRQDELLARQLGFDSFAALSRAPRRPSTIQQFTRLPAEARAIRADASAAIAAGRRRGISLHEAAFEVGVPLEAVWWWFPDAIRRSSVGELFATASDSGVRMRPIVVDGEVTFMPVGGSAAADRVAGYFDVQWRYIHGRASPADVAALPAVTVGGRRLERDPQVLERLALAGEFALDDIYRELVG